MRKEKQQKHTATLPACGTVNDACAIASNNTTMYDYRLWVLLNIFNIEKVCAALCSRIQLLLCTILRFRENIFVSISIQAHIYVYIFMYVYMYFWNLQKMHFICPYIHTHTHTRHRIKKNS